MKRKLNAKKEGMEFKKTARMLNMDVIKTENGSVKRKAKCQRMKKKTLVKNETSEESDIDELSICQDNDCDILVIDLIDPNITDKATSDLCSVCGDIGKDREL